MIDSTMADEDKRFKVFRIISLLLIALLMSTPFACQLIRFGECYPFIGADEPDYVAPLIRHAQANGLGFCEPFIYEYRDKEFPYPQLPFSILGFFSAIIGIEAVFFLLHVFGPVIIFLILRRLLEKIGLEPVTALVGAFAYVVLFHIIDTVQIFVTEGPFAGLFLLRQSTYPMTWSIFRVIDPAFTRIFFFLALLLYVEAVNRKSFLFAILCGLISSIVIELRFYDWTLLLPMIFFIGTRYFLIKDTTSAKISAISLALPAILLVFYFIKRQSMLSMSSDTFYRNAIEPGLYLWPSRFTDVLTFVGLVAVNILVWRTALRYYILAFSISFLVMMNAQNIIGYNVAPFHWKVVHAYPVISSVLIAVALLSVKRFWKFAPYTIGIILILYAFISYTRYKFIPFDREKIHDIKKIVNHVGKSDVVISEIGLETMNFGNHYVFVPYSAYSVVPTKELYERWILHMRLIGDAKPDVEGLKRLTFFHQTRFSFGWTLGRDEYLKRLKLSDDDVNFWRRMIDELPSDRAQLLKLLRSKFKADWLVVSASNAGKLDRISGLNLVYNGPRLVLFRITL